MKRDRVNISFYASPGRQDIQIQNTALSIFFNTYLNFVKLKKSPLNSKYDSFRSILDLPVARNLYIFYDVFLKSQCCTQFSMSLETKLNRRPWQLPSEEPLDTVWKRIPSIELFKQILPDWAVNLRLKQTVTNQTRCLVSSVKVCNLLVIFSSQLRVKLSTQSVEVEMNIRLTLFKFHRRQVVTVTLGV